MTEQRRINPLDGFILEALSYVDRNTWTTLDDTFKKVLVSVNEAFVVHPGRYFAAVGYLVQRRYVAVDDKFRLLITEEGNKYYEQTS